MIGTIGTAAKFRTAGSRSDARGTARGMRRTAADSIMASQFYKNGSHDSWESTKCRGTTELWLPRSVEAKTLEIEASVSVAYAADSYQSITAQRHRKTQKTARRAPSNPHRHTKNRPTKHTGKCPPTPHRTFPSASHPDHSIDMSLLSSCDKGHCLLPNAACGARLHDSAAQLTHR